MLCTAYNERVYYFVVAAAKQRKIIPVIYKPITELSILSGINACDRTKVLEDQWFWDNLVRSLTEKNSSRTF